MPADLTAPRPPRILFVINSLAGGGAERVLCTLLAASGDRLARHDVRLLLLDRDPDRYSPPAAVPTTRLDCRHGLLNSIRAVRRVAAEWRPDVALSFLTRGNIATVLAMRAIGRPSIISERVHTAAHLAGSRFAFASRALVRWIYPMAARIVAVSGGVGDGLVEDFGIDPARIGICYNPVDAPGIAAAGRAEPAIAVDPDDLVAMGRLVVNKNFPMAIRAFAASRSRGRLLILGAGPLHDDLLAVARDAGVADRVVLAGFQADPYPIVARARALLLTSNAEGFSNTLVEGMALGKPCISTDCRSGPCEILQVSAPPAGGYCEGTGGLLIPTNDVAAMTAAIDALDDAALFARLAESGRRRVQDFSVARAVETFWGEIDRQLETRA